MRYGLPLLTAFTLASTIGCAHKSSSAPRAAAITNAGRFDQVNNPVIVRMAGRDKTLTISSTARGPAYSVNRADGELLLSEGNLDDLRRIAPDLYRHVRSALVSARVQSSAYEAFLDYQLIAESR